MSHTQITESQERIKQAQAIMALKFAEVKEGSVLYWHYLTIINKERDN